jgi:hypothetical protein
MNWVGEALRFPVEEENELWITALGEKVAALGGQLEVVAVFPDKRMTSMREPEPGDVWLWTDLRAFC